MARRRQPQGPAVHHLRAELLGVRRPVVRELLVRSEASLAVLHDVLQAAFDWDDAHMHEFAVRPGALRGRDGEDSGAVDEGDLTLAHALPRDGSALEYVYDFGDSWEVRVSVVERRPLAPDDGLSHVARLVAGQGAAPPEDCGGAYGYDRLCQASTDPSFPDRDEILEWWGGEPFDPEAFDASRTGARVAQVGAEPARRSPRGAGSADGEDDDAGEGDAGEDDLGEDDFDEDEDFDSDDVDDDPTEMDDETVRAVLEEFPYDPDGGSHLARWLDLDEGERQLGVQAHHRAHGLAVGKSAPMHAMMHAVVETQLASVAPPVTAETLARLRAAGVGRHAAVHAIGSVVVAQLHGLLTSRRPFDETQYARDLRALDPADWR